MSRFGLQSTSLLKALVNKELGHPLSHKRSLPSWWHFMFLFYTCEMFMKRKNTMQEKLHKPNEGLFSPV